jgi:hypothetical protein
VQQNRKRTYVLLMFWVLLSAVTASGADVSGRWAGTMVASNGGPERFLLILEQNGTKVVGTAGASDADRHVVEKGAVEGDRLTFQVQTPEGTLAFDLTIKGDQITGTMAFKKGDQVLTTAQVSVKRQ